MSHGRGQRISTLCLLGIVSDVGNAGDLEVVSLEVLMNVRGSVLFVFFVTTEGTLEGGLLLLRRCMDIFPGLGLSDYILRLR